MEEIITLDYGSGGKKTAALIENLIVPAFNNPALAELGDGAVLAGAGNLVFTTDSFVVHPMFFPGGDIGKLAVFGTVNDIVMCGGAPKYLSLAFIIEEGLRISDLRRVISSIKSAAEISGINIVTGDTKVVERGKGDGLYINTSGVGFLKYPGLSRKNLREGDAVIVSGTVGDHGTAVMLARNDFVEGKIESDCAPLSVFVDALFTSGAEVRVLRDPTRGGVATTLNEFIEGSAFGIELDESAIPFRADVKAACDLLGLDPMYCANEGKLIAVVSAETAEEALAGLRGKPKGANAAIIGRVGAKYPGRVVMSTAFGGSRVLQKLTGAQLPRIC